MKKILLAAALILTMAAGQASAFTVTGPATQPVTMFVTGVTTTFPLTASTVDTWGIFQVTSLISNTTSETVWSSSSTDHLYGAIWGLVDAPSSTTSPYQVQKGQFAIFESATNKYIDLLSSSDAINGNPLLALNTLFGSTSVLNGNFAPDVIPDTVTGTTMVTNSSAQFTPASGDGKAYLNVTDPTSPTAGTQNAQFDSNLQNGGSDLFFEFSFNTRNVPSGWGANIASASINGTVVPEPGTMALLGFGMLGLAIFGKRRMNKEA